MPTMEQLTDPAMAEHRLWRVWPVRMAQVRDGWVFVAGTYAQHVDQPLPAWWQAAGPYSLVLARTGAEALEQLPVSNVQSTVGT